MKHETQEYDVNTVASDIDCQPYALTVTSNHVITTSCYGNVTVRLEDERVTLKSERTRKEAIRNFVKKMLLHLGCGRNHLN